MNGKTLEDLYSSILADPMLPMSEKVSLINDLRAKLSASSGTSLQALTPRLVGLGLGVLLSRYFGFGLLGTAAASLGGYGLGAAFGNAFPHQRGALREIESFAFKGATMNDVLELDEKRTAVKVGALMALRLTGVIPDAQHKEAGLSDAPVVGLGAVLGLGALLGAGAHAADRATSPDGVTEVERLKRIQYLLDATDRAKDEARLQANLARGIVPMRRAQ